MRSTRPGSAFPTSHCSESSFPARHMLLVLSTCSAHTRLVSCCSRICLSLPSHFTYNCFILPHAILRLISYRSHAPLTLVSCQSHTGGSCRCHARFMFVSASACSFHTSLMFISYSQHACLTLVSCLSHIYLLLVLHWSYAGGIGLSAAMTRVFSLPIDRRRKITP